MKVKDLLFASIGEKPNTMLVNDETIISIDYDYGLYTSSIYGHWYYDKFLDMQDLAVKFFSYDASENFLHIIIEEDNEDESI